MDTDCDRRWRGLAEAGYEGYCEHLIETVDPRSATYNGRDSKPRSLLYAGFIQKRGWDRDFYNGIEGRRFHKKSARRYRRREEKAYIRNYEREYQ